MPPLFVVRRVTAADLPALARVQATAYVPALHESLDVFAALLDLFPAGCFGLFDEDELVAYFITHPGNRLELPPALNSTHDSGDVGPPDLYYLHDLAVAPAVQKLGAGKRLLAVACNLAAQTGFVTLALTAVQAAMPFWQNLGFELLSAASLSRAGFARLKEYTRASGVPAVVMLADVKVVQSRLVRNGEHCRSRDNDEALQRAAKL